MAPPGRWSARRDRVQPGLAVPTCLSLRDLGSVPRAAGARERTAGPRENLGRLVTGACKSIQLAQTPRSQPCASRPRSRRNFIFGVRRKPEKETYMASMASPMTLQRAPVSARVWSRRRRRVVRWADRGKAVDPGAARRYGLVPTWASRRLSVPTLHVSTDRAPRQSLHLTRLLRAQVCMWYMRTGAARGMTLYVGVRRNLVSVRVASQLRPFYNHCASRLLAGRCHREGFYGVSSFSLDAIPATHTRTPVIGL
jgi:hypothetical protein